MGPFMSPWLLEHTPDVTDLQWLITRASGFVLLGLIVWRFIVPVIAGILEERRRTIVDATEQIRLTLEEAASARNDYRDRLDRIADEVSMRMGEALREAEELREQIGLESRETAQAITRRARSEVERDRLKALARLRIELSEHIVDAARYATSRTLTPERQSRLVQEFVNQIGAPR